MAVLVATGGKRSNRMTMRGLQVGIAGSGIAGVFGSTFDSQFGLSGAYDGLPSKPVMFATNGTLIGIKFDARLVSNGDFEAAFSGGFPAAITTGWGLQGAPTITRNTTEVQSGTGALQIGGVGGGDVVTFDCLCSPGDFLQITVAGRKKTAGSGNAAQVQVQNIVTGLWLSSGGAWIAGTTLFSNSTAAYSSVTLSFQVESFDACQTEDVILRVYLWSGGGTLGTHDAVYDNFQIVPGVDIVSVHGSGYTYTLGGVRLSQSLGQGTAVNVRTSPDDVTYTAFQNMTPKPTSFYKTFTRTYSFFWALVLNNAQLVPYSWGNIFPYLGEVFFGQTVTLQNGVDNGIKMKTIDPQLSSRTALGEARSVLLSSAPHRQVDLTFKWPGRAAFIESRDNIFRMNRNGAYPLMIVVDDTDPDMAIFGCPPGSDFDAVQKYKDWWTGELTVVEAPFPQWIA
jgi:hypothetical protein